MRELHVVALSEDGRHVVLATRAGAAPGEFRVALDERLTAAVRGELPAPGRDTAPSISPRDIQARLRDGESPEDIAASAGVPLSRVERYAGPVLAELDRMITGARAAVVHRPRLGPSALPLGEAVETHLAELAHVAEGSVRWSARRADLGRWVVEVSWTARGRRRTAGWRYDPVARELTAVDGPSAVLGHAEAETVAAPAAGRATRPAAAPAGRAAARGPARSASTSAAARASSTGASLTEASAASRPTGAAASTARGARAAAAPARPAATGRRAQDRPATAGQAAAARALQAAAGAQVEAAAPATARTAARPTAARPTARATAARTAAVPRATPAAAAPATATAARRRAAPPTAPAADTAPPAASGAAPAARAPGRRTATARTATAQDPGPTRATPARAPSRRPASRRSAVPSLDELAGPAPSPSDAASPATQPPATQPPATPTPADPTPATPASRQMPAGPPVLRVVPPADPEPPPEADTASLPERQPARRAAGGRAGGRDWADVLMGAAPAPPARGPQED